MYHQYWIEFSRGSEYLNNLFIYLNTQYVKKNSNNEAELAFGSSVDSNDHIMDIGEMALDCWRKHMIEPLKDKLVRLILDGIDRDRRGESVSQSVVHGVIISLVDVADKRQKTLGVSLCLFFFLHF